MFLGNAADPNALRRYAFSVGITDAGGMLTGEREGNHELANASAARLYDYALSMGVTAAQLDTAFGWLPGTADTWSQNNGRALLRGQSVYVAPEAPAAPVYSNPTPPAFTNTPAVYLPPAGGVTMPAPPAPPMTYEVDGPTYTTMPMPVGPDPRPMGPPPPAPVYNFGDTPATPGTPAPTPAPAPAASGGVPWGLLALAAAAAFLA